MKQILEKYKVYIVIALIVIAFLSIRSCISNQYNQAKGENKVLKEQMQKAQDGAKVAEQRRLELKDSIKAENIKKEQKLKDLSEKVLQSEKRVLSLQEQNKKDKVVIAKLTYVEQAKEYNSIYNTTNAKPTDISVNLEGDLGNRVLETIADANTCQDIVKEKDIQLVAKDSVIFTKDGQLKDSSVLLLSAENSIDKYKLMQESNVKYLNGVLKENSKLKTKNFLNKVLIPVAFGIGTYIGVKTAK